MDTPKKYQVDFPVLAALLLPTPLRRRGMAGLMAVLADALATIHASLLEMRTRKLAQLQYNGQVCRMEACLNAYFNKDADPSDPAAPSIAVVDGQQTAADPFYLYRRDTAYSIDLAVHAASDKKHIMLNRRSLNAQGHCDFLVLCPKSLPVDTKRLASVVNTIKVPGRKWQLERI